VTETAGAALARIEREVIACRRCPRLVAWREQAAAQPPRRFRGEKYWARPVPALGDPRGRILLVGLAPAAHGGNRTGRMFTGDESGNFLFRALHEAGLSNQPVSRSREDGTRVSGALISAACRCAPPDNKPLPEELANCFEYVAREAALLRRPRVFVALGGLAFRTCLALLAAEGAPLPRPRPRFAHGAFFRIGGDALLATYHPSQQNTFTGRLTPAMLRAVFRRAVREARAATGARSVRSGR
jgi:uracil-DNA glycosylase family 4